MSDYDILKSKDIIEILDGDKQLGEIEGARVSLPYLSGPDLCSILTQFGKTRDYSWRGGSPSRWVYVTELLTHCIENNTINKLLAYLFRKEGFQQQLKSVHISKIDFCYDYIITNVLSEINKILYFNDKELVKVNGQFFIKRLEQELNLEIPVIETINRDYIRGLYERASKDIDENNFDSAITKCRTLIEEVFCYAIEQANEEPSDKGDIQTLYNRVKDLYNMHSNKDIDKRINTLLSGLNKIISAIAEMRNSNSDSHGVGARRIAIEEHHARLILNSASTIAEFLLAVVNKKRNQTVTGCNRLSGDKLSPVVRFYRTTENNYKGELLNGKR